ncbi:MAG: TonB-dependent receptor [Deltaproteobacteria bacterium]|nr:TonB-dependent receptor [Deltaproteobacteria bacterium]
MPGEGGLSPEEWSLVESAEPYFVEARPPALPAPGVPVEIVAGPFASDLVSSVAATAGARAVRSGGPLSRAELRVRGLGGPRLAITLNGIPLDDPAGGQTDLSALDSDLLAGGTLLRGPETGAVAAQALAGALALQTAPIPDGAGARLRLGLGSEQTGAVRGRASYGTGRLNGAISVALGSTAGDFDYRPVSFSGDTALVGDLRTRANNDQARRAVTGLAEARSEQVQSQLLLHLTEHGGGIAGLSGHPTPDARFLSRALLFGNRTSVFFPWLVLGLELSARQRAELFAVAEALAPVATSASIWSLRSALTCDLPSLTRALEVRLAFEGTQAVAQQRSAAREAALAAVEPEVRQRQTLGAVANGRVHFFAHRLAADFGARVDAISDVGVEPSLSGRLSAALARSLVAEAYVGRAFRAPTFDEKNGPPAGYLRSNPDLVPEDGIESGALLRWSGGAWSAEAALFGARLSHAIVYLNRNAYEVRPENAGDLWRAGGELTVAVRPLRCWQQSAEAEILYSRLDATAAPLPTTPLLRLRARSALDLAALAPVLPVSFYLDGQAQSATSSNYFGELTVPAQAALDAGVAIRLRSLASFSLEVWNLLDATTRVDLHQVPLPGRQIMATLTVGV